MFKKSIFCIFLMGNVLNSASAWTNTAPTGTYLVTLTNQTYAQGFSFPVAATHPNGFHVFEEGQYASVQAANIAQIGTPVPMFNMLSGKLATGDVTDVYGHPFPMASGGAITAPWPAGLPYFDALGVEPGTTRVPGLKPTLASQTLVNGISFTIGANQSDRFSLIMMMMCTNDGLAGLDSVKLPENMGETKTYNVFAYDAGVEKNTELSADIVDPCGLMAPRDANGQPQVSTNDGNRNSSPSPSQTPPSTASDDYIKTSSPITKYSNPSISGIGNIPANFAWKAQKPVGTVTITKLDGDYKNSHGKESHED